MLRFSCPCCGVVASVPVECAGRTTKCPGCGKNITAPKPTANRVLSPLPNKKTDTSAPAKPVAHDKTPLGHQASHSPLNGKPETPAAKPVASPQPNSESNWWVTANAEAPGDSQARTPIRCPTCSKVNPGNAAYCFYDGRALATGSQQGPLRLATMPFPAPFFFANGQSCANFNQLVLACNERWNEARSLLADGVWPSFFGAMGRMDLAALAIRSAKETDLDVGLTHLLEQLPADAEARRPPKLAMLLAEEDLGTLEPGKDRKFELHLSNQGMLVLRGMVKTDCDWLSFGDRQGGAALKMFQTRNDYTVPVHVLGDKLRAGRQPLEGRIVIDTNGGTATFLVRANVPVRPFPKGQYANDALAGATSPRELAVKAKDHSREAAVLFEQGAVKAWYASNGWIYPVQGTQGTGKGAVQQFFDALGLSKPPLLEINTERILCKGKVGQRLTKHVTISTKESRFVYAQASSTRDWIKADPGQAQGNTFTIPLHIEVPPCPGETLHADVTFQGNGQQRFVVPVSLTVAAASPHVDAGPEKTKGGLPLRWILAGAALLLVITVGGIVLARSRAPKPIVAKIEPAPVPVPVPPWWDGIPNCELTAAAAALKRSAPEEQSLFDSIAAKDDVDRYKPYEQLAAKLPELVRNPKTKEPLGQFLRDCCVHESSDLAIAPLLRALARQLPRMEDVAFRPEEKGGELERAAFALEVVFSAMKNRAIRPKRAQSLVNELGRVFGISLDTSAPPDELEVQTEKLLALQCYRNLRATATKEIDHALEMRRLLIAKYPQHLSPDVRDEVDVELIAVGLSKGNDLSPKLESILKTCLESKNLAIDVQIVGLYEKANPDLAQKMEAVLAVRFKAAIDPKLTHAEKIKMIRRDLVAAKISPAERRAQLQKLAGSTLAGVQPGERKTTVLLQDTVRLSHASLLASTLFHKDADVARFDELVAEVPGIVVAEPVKGDEKKKPGDKPKQPAAEAIVVGAQPKVGKLSPESARDPIRNKAFCKEYVVAMKAGQHYSVVLLCTAFIPYLRLEASNGTIQATNDGKDSTNTHIAQIAFTAPSDGDYRVIATTSRNGAEGSYALQIQLQDPGFGPFGPPPRFVRRFVPGLGFQLVPMYMHFPPPPVPMAVPMVVPVEPKPVEDKEKPVSQSDLIALAYDKSTTRVKAFKSLAGSVRNDLAAQDAQKIARYLLATIQQQSELDDVTPTLESIAKNRPLLVALADSADVTKKDRAEVIVGVVLGKPVRFDRDEDWRPTFRKMLLQRALDLTDTTMGGADQAADILRYLYQEQGRVLGIDDPEFQALSSPARVLERIVQHVAAKANGTQNSSPEDKMYLEQIGRHLQAAQFVAGNDLEHMVLLQRIWIKVLSIYLREQAPAQAARLLKIQQDLAVHDQNSLNVLDQLRAGEEKILRIWALAHNLK